MEKKLLCALLIIGSFIVFSTAAGSMPVSWNNTPIQELDTCDAPPPTNFHVTGRGLDFITVAWNPAWAGATHTLVVFTKSSNNNWVLLDTFFNVPGTGYTVQSVSFNDECKLVISTNCLSGERSIYVIEEIDKIIIELDVAGRRPKNPVKLDGCVGVSLEDFEWVGFQVNSLDGNQTKSNMFELKIISTLNEKNVKINRVFENIRIYAVDKNNFWPSPKRFTPNPFKMAYLTEQGIPEDIGFVGLTTILYNPLHVELCKFLDYPWDDLYEYSIYVAAEVYPPHPPEGTNDERENRKVQFANYQTIKVQNPFGETISAFFPPNFKSNEKVKFQLFNLNGQQILNFNETNFEGQVFLPAKEVQNGTYFLRIFTEFDVFNFKIIKTN